MDENYKKEQQEEEDVNNKNSNNENNNNNNNSNGWTITPEKKGGERNSQKFPSTRRNSNPEALLSISDSLNIPNFKTPSKTNNEQFLNLTTPDLKSNFNLSLNFSPLDDLFSEAEELQKLSNREHPKTISSMIMPLTHRTYEEDRKRKVKAASFVNLPAPPKDKSVLLRKLKSIKGKGIDPNHFVPVDPELKKRRKETKNNSDSSLLSYPAINFLNNNNNNNNNINNNDNRSFSLLHNMDNFKHQSSPALESYSENKNYKSNSSWSSKQAIIGEWATPLPSSKMEFEPLIARTILEKGYLIENGNIKRANDFVDEREIYFRDSDKGFFRLLLSESQQGIENYYGETSTEVFIISIELIKEKKFQRVLLRSSKEDQRLLIPGNSISKILKELSIQFPILRDVKFTKVREEGEGWSTGLLKFEDTQIVTTYKFGILNSTDGQLTDDHFFNNQIISEDFEEFLEFIGQKIALKDWDKFRGGLDIKTNKTGDYSVYASHKGYEIMFHVAAFLPFNNLDAQQVERKRHLGNDVNLIIFKEGETPFDPLEIKSQFNHVFFVIQKVKDKERGEGYLLEACCKPGVIPFHPFISQPNFYPKNDDFRDFLLTKLINAERAAMFAKDFRVKLTRTRKMLLSSLISDERKK